MEDDCDSPMVVKVEKHQQCVIFTYFHGDTNSMVDAHFARALNTVCTEKALTPRAKRIRKTVKTGEGCEGDLTPRRQLNRLRLIFFIRFLFPEKNPSCQGTAMNPYVSTKVPPVGGLLSLSPVDDAPEAYSFTTREGPDSPGLPSIAYTLSSGGLGLTGQQYATSLLNLLHTDQAEGGPSGGPSTSKPELHHNWMMQQGFRDSVDPTFEPGETLMEIKCLSKCPVNG